MAGNRGLAQTLLGKYTEELGDGGGAEPFEQRAGGVSLIETEEVLEVAAVGLDGIGG